MLKHLCLTFIVATVLLTPQARAQDAADSEVEALYEKEEVKQDSKSRPKTESKAPTKEVQSLSDLATLAPFTDVAVIQRRFLPKTGRFELSASGFSNLNNPYFNQFGIAPRLAYYIRERYAVEILGAFATISSRQVTDDLLHNRNISTDNVASSRGFYALAFKWNPIYGKITWLNRTIVPFDLNFNLGAGMSMMSGGSQAPTVHFGTSQVFALSKSMAFRWDLIVNNYTASIKDSTGAKSTLNQNDLLLGIGMSFYFPEATYR